MSTHITPLTLIPLKCDQCNKIFSSLSNLENHKSKRSLSSCKFDLLNEITSNQKEMLKFNSYLKK